MKRSIVYLVRVSTPRKYLELCLFTKRSAAERFMNKFQRYTNDPLTIVSFPYDIEFFPLRYGHDLDAM